MSTRLEISETGRGNAELRERGETIGDGLFDVITLLETETPIDHVSLNAFFEQGEWEGGVTVEMSVYHVSDGDSRAFHMHLEADLEWAAVERLHTFLACLLTARKTL